MSSLLVPPLASDPRSQVLERLSQRLESIDRTVVLVYLIDLVPADALPYLAEQFNVAALWPYLPDDSARRRAIKESVAWHRAKGTPWAVETALSWAGHEVIVEDLSATASRWAEYQLEFRRALVPDAVPEVLKLARFAAPRRSHLVRMYGGYDHRPIRLDDGPKLDDGWLDDDSGVEVSGVKLSFGTRSAALIVLDETGLHASMSPMASTSISDDNSWRLDAWALDSEILLDSSGGLVSQVGHSLDDTADEEVLLIGGEVYTAAMLDEPLLTTGAGRIDQVSHAMRGKYRGWSGAWSGPWREPIPSKLTEEFA